MEFRIKFFCLQFVVLVVALAALVPICRAQQYPSRAVDIVVPYAPGGSVDTFFRAIREALAKELKVAVNIVNRPGGGGVVGSSFVANSKTDGYTLLGQERESFLLAQIITPKIPYNVLKDFDLIASCANIPMVLAVRADSEFKTIEDLISYAKKNPGKLIAGTPGVGSSPHLEIELLKSAAGINITHLPLGGGGEVIPNLLGGHVDLTTVGISILKPHIKAGKIRVLVTCSPERIPDFPEIPTTREKGIQDVNINLFYCLLGPKGLPLQIGEKLTRAVDAVLKSSEVLVNLNRLGYAADFLAPDQFRERLERDFKSYIDVAKKAGVAKIQD